MTTQKALRHPHHLLGKGFTRTAVKIAAVVTLPMLSVGCGDTAGWNQAREAAGNGDAMRELQTYFDGHPQCARVLRPAGAGGMMAADPGDPAAQALRDAGLIEPVSGGGGEERYRPAAFARRWFRESRSAGVVEYQLCFARRRISHVLIDATGAEPGLRYVFSLDKPAPWLGMPAIKAAFPGAEQAMLATYPGSEKLPFRDGHVVVDGIGPTQEQPTLFAFGVMFK